MYTVTVDHGHRTEQYGPFPTAGRASGWGFTRYGTNSPYSRPRWWVRPLRSPRKAAA